ncbi:MAG: lysylphosphatidylglycerol synthase domain-containing protein [Candidatus Omnitrophota bacterium]|jgi:uncharacterized membrane protein YbhN (UPF0104 family)
MGNVVLIVLVLGFSLCVNSFLLVILLNRRASLWEGIKFFSVAAALNKLFFTGSGYAILCWKMKGDDIPLSRTLPAFAVFELFSTLPWLVLGIYSGGKLAFRIPVVLPFIFLFVLISLLIARKKAAGFFNSIARYFSEISPHAFIVVFLVTLNLILTAAYYFLLMEAFHFSFGFMEAIRIVSIAFSAGYLSPVPQGLGIKESCQVFLLMDQGVSLKQAVSFAVTDRVILTGFYLGLGFLFGADIIRQEIKSKFKRRVREK